MEINYEKFRHRLPYASEIFGQFQPIIGWKSKRIKRRVFVRPGPTTLPNPVRLNSDFQLDGVVDLFKLPEDMIKLDVPEFLQCTFVAYQAPFFRHLARANKKLSDDEWKQLLAQDRLNDFFKDKTSKFLFDAVIKDKKAEEVTAPGTVDRLPDVNHYLDQQKVQLNWSRESAGKVLNSLMAREASVARYLHALSKDDPAALNRHLLSRAPYADLKDLIGQLNPGYLFDKDTTKEAVLSPIGLVHLYRQYFYEFANFLGPPVEHIWVGPGTTIELIEISTRRSLVERTFEQFAEQITRFESGETTQDELSEAIREENQKNTKLGSSLSLGVNVFIFSANATGNASLEETQKVSRENMHKTMRQQSSKLSTEIRNNFKSTFRTVTETTDTKSKRYLIENKGLDLANYELRRKMRQVGIQMQDIGTQLCWQVYVDDPGRNLGIAELIHLASKVDLSQYPTLAIVDEPKPQETRSNIDLIVPKEGQRSDLVAELSAGFVGAYLGGGIPGAAVGVALYEVFKGLFGDDEEEHDWFEVKSPNLIFQRYQVPVPKDHYLAAGDLPAPDPQGFSLKHGIVPVRWIPRNGQGVEAGIKILDPDKGIIEVIVTKGNVTPGETIEFEAILKATPKKELLDNIKQLNAANAEKNKSMEIEKNRKIREEFIKSVQERVKQASQIKVRSHVELREEERTVVYRKLLSDLMSDTWNTKLDAESRRLAHLRSELVRSIFDVDKMLYFVAPEWWQPRLHQSGQTAAIGQDQLGAEDAFLWGGEGRADNYWITSDSDPARLGSSLGWLLQLDGDNLRNAFLNAPWVKAVIPIHPGKARQGLDWLMQAKVEGSDGLDELYGGTEEDYEDLTVRDVLYKLADRVDEKHRKSQQVQSTTEVGPDGSSRTLYYLPAERFFEYGFDPLKGGFRLEKPIDFEVYDQWIEILPTDQIVAVPVAYDAATGMMK